MGRTARTASLVGGVLVLAAALLAAGTAFSSPGGSPDPAQQVAEAPSAPPVDAQAKAIADLQAELVRVPMKFDSWSTLGFAYLSQARQTADPTLYAKAEGAFDRSLQIRPKENPNALTGEATLAATRHDFAKALALTDQSLAINDYSATTYAVHTDALTELGHYDQALAAARKILDLSPGVSAYSRLSYQFELRGDLVKARLALEQARDEANIPADRAFAEHYLGELAFNAGDFAAARTHEQAALAADPGYTPSLAGRAKAEAAGGDVKAGLRDYAAVVDRLPLPLYVVEYGELLQADGQQQAADEQYAVVRALQKLFVSQGADVDLELALFEADHGDPATALKYAKAAYTTRPDAVLVDDAYAWALHVNGRDAEALPVADRALRLGFRSALLYAHRGVIKASLGQRTAAAKDLQTALDINPRFNPVLVPRITALMATLK